MQEDDQKAEKQALRKRLKGIRQKVGEQEAALAASAVARHYADHPHLAFAKSLAIYAAMQKELDVLPVLEQMLPYRKVGALPRIQTGEKPLTFHRYMPGDALKRHGFGQLEPLESAEAIVPEIVLVPLLGFDGKGHRLGYGGGYYDATMQALRSTLQAPPLFIGVGYSFQEVAQLPVQAHDQRLNGVLTELGVSMFP